MTYIANLLLENIRSIDLFRIIINNTCMKTSVWTRVVDVVAYSGLSKSAFAKKIDMEQTTVNNQLLGKRGISIDLVSNILKTFDQISAEWLITGKGAMIKGLSPDESKNAFGSIQGDSNTIEYKNAGNVEFGNNINVPLPETGTQKIIKPDGTVEIASVDSSNFELENAKREIEELRLTISHLKDNMSVKDELIASLKETIELLKHRQM